MKNYFAIYKPFLLFLSKFFLAYLVLTILYQGYLGKTDAAIDAITENVAHLTEKSAHLMGISIATVKEHMHYNIIYHNKIVAHIIEGCNAISVIILFIAFVVAFSGNLKPTLLFVFCGSLLIYILNIARIVMLSVLMYYFPEQEHLLHGVVFPLIIYGSVFILWVIWVNKFSRYASKTA